MLSDDIATTINSVGSTISRVATSAVRGALLFGAVALIAFAAAYALMPAMMTLGITGLGLGLASSLHTGAAAMSLLMVAKVSAIVGAVTLGVTSLIPGSNEGFGLKKLLPSAAPPSETPPQISPAIERAPQPEMDNNLYKEGLGASIINRDAANATAQGVGRS